MSFVGGRWWREPLLHFVLLAALAGLFQHFWLDELVARWWPQEIELSAAELNHLRAQWRSETGREPNQQELTASLQDFFNTEILLRESRKLGLHLHDSVVSQRLIKNMRFLHQDEQADAQSLFDAAMAIGMLDTDPVVRRRLTQRMRYRIESQVRVSEQDLQAYFSAHRDDWQVPTQISFEQRYFSADRRADAARQDAQHALPLLLANDSAALASAGDPFLLGEQFAPTAQSKLASSFGQAFVDQLLKSPLGQWSGPISSAYGEHLVKLQGIQPAHPAKLEQVRPQVVAALYTQTERAAVHEQLQRWHKRYRLVLPQGVTQ